MTIRTAVAIIATLREVGDRPFTTWDLAIWCDIAYSNARDWMRELKRRGLIVPCGIAPRQGAGSRSVQWRVKQ